MATEPTPPFSDVKPEWNNNETNISAPSPAQKSDGWTTNEKPTSAVRNDLETKDAKWINFLNDIGFRDWKTGVSFIVGQRRIDPNTDILYKVNTAHTSTGSTLTENDLANWDVVSKDLNQILGPFIDGEMVVGDTATGNLKKSTVADAVGPIIVNDPGIINGNFEHWQAIPSTVPNAPAGLFAADLFRYNRNGTMRHTVARTIDFPTVGEGAQAGVNFSMLVEVTTANTGLDASEFTVIEYFKEGFDFAPYFGQTFTLTFFAKSSLTGIYTVGFRNGDFTRSFVSEYTIDVANTWEKKTITVTHDTTGTWNLDQNLGISITWVLAGGSGQQTPAGSWVNGNFFTTAAAVNFDAMVGNEFRITQASLNIGATSRNNLKSTSEELHRIARVFKVLNSVKYGFAKDGNGQAFSWHLPFQRSMRATPLVTVSAEFPTGQIGSPVIDQITINGLAVTLASTGGSDQNVSNVFTLTLDSRFDP